MCERLNNTSKSLKVLEERNIILRRRAYQDPDAFFEKYVKLDFDCEKFLRDEKLDLEEERLDTPEFLLKELEELGGID